MHKASELNPGGSTVGNGRPQRHLRRSRRRALDGRAAAIGLALGAMLAVAESAPTIAQTRPAAPPTGQATPPQPRATPQPGQEKVFPLGQAWTAVSLNGRPLGGERPTMIVDDQLRGRGFAGCNTWSATAFPLREQAFAVGPVAVTRRACSAEIMAAERSFLTALRGARKWDLVAGALVVTGVAGELRFERAL